MVLAVDKQLVWPTPTAERNHKNMKKFRWFSSVRLVQMARYPEHRLEPKTVVVLAYSGKSAAALIHQSVVEQNALMGWAPFPGRKDNG